jgi:hypothetical protein
VNVQGILDSGRVRRVRAVLFIGMVCIVGTIHCRTASGSGQIRAEKIGATVEAIRQAVSASSLTPEQKRDIGEKLDSVARDSRTIGKDFDSVAAERDEYKEDSDTLTGIYYACGAIAVLVLIFLFFKFRPSITGALSKVFSGGVSK